MRQHRAQGGAGQQELGAVPCSSWGCPHLRAHLDAAFLMSITVCSYLMLHVLWRTTGISYERQCS